MERPFAGSRPRKRSGPWPSSSPPSAPTPWCAGAIPAHASTWSTSRSSCAFSALDQMDAWAVDEPGWEILKICVDPAHQGKGIGSALIRHVLEICEREGQAAYLESSNPTNLPFYGKRGFEVLGEIQVGSSPTLFPLLRHPR